MPAMHGKVGRGPRHLLAHVLREVSDGVAPQNAGGRGDTLPDLRLLAEEDARRQAQEVAAAKLVATQVEAAAETPPAPPSEHPPPQKFSNDGSFLEQMRRQLAAASRIQTAWRNRAAVADAPAPPGEPVNDLKLALEAHSELKAHEARAATRKPLRPRN